MPSPAPLPNALRGALGTPLPDPLADPLPEHAPDLLSAEALRAEHQEKIRILAGKAFGDAQNKLKELLTNYGEIGMLWFDGGSINWTKSVGAEVYNYARSLQPNIIINNRVMPFRKFIRARLD